jgi:hypothetical protein
VDSVSCKDLEHGVGTPKTYVSLFIWVKRGEMAACWRCKALRLAGLTETGGRRRPSFLRLLPVEAR